MAVFGKTHLTRSTDLIAAEPLLRKIGFETINETHGPRQSRRTRTHLSEYWARLGLLDAFRDDIEARNTKNNLVRPSPLGYEHYYDTYVARRAKQFLETYNEERPFFCWLSFPGPHEPYDAPEPYASMFSPNDMPPATARPETVGGAPGVLQELISTECPENLHLTSVEIAALRANYAGGVRLIDDLIGEIVDLLKQKNLYENTVILFTSDHGEMNGDWGLLRKKVFLDGAARVPLVVKPAEAMSDTVRSAKSNALIELMDVGPTLVDLAKLAGAPSFGGRSFAKQMFEPAAEHREIIFGQYENDRMFLSKDWKLVLNENERPSLLFNRQDDPDEQRNLCTEVDYASLFDVPAILAGLSSHGGDVV